MSRELWRPRKTERPVACDPWREVYPHLADLPVESTQGTLMTDRRKVLIVEPLRDAASSLAEILGSDGWDIVRADDVVPAYQLARGAQPAAVIVRDPIPGGGALALLQRLRRSAHTALIP